MPWLNNSEKNRLNKEFSFIKYIYMKEQPVHQFSLLQIFPEMLACRCEFNSIREDIITWISQKCYSHEIPQPRVSWLSWVNAWGHLTINLPRKSDSWPSLRNTALRISSFTYTDNTFIVINEDYKKSKK